MNVIRIICLLQLLLLGALQPLTAQDARKEIRKYRKNQLREISRGEHAPLLKEDLKSVSFFDFAPEFRIEAKVERLTNEKPFSMPTYAGTTKEFIRFARLHFTIGGKSFALTAYKNLSLPPAVAAMNTTYFIPFKDETNDEESYGGGRYMDVSIPADTDIILLDFNKAYNPYCAYSDGYRCPVPPFENHLPVAVPAGEKNYTGVKRTRR